jgi:apolipoprotein N-acyltransferase
MTVVAERPATGEAAGPVSGTHRRAVAGGLGLSALSGALAVLALPPYGFEWLMWVAWVPMVVAQHRVLPQRLSGVALGVGIGIFWAGFVGPALTATEGGTPGVFYAFPLIIAGIVWALARRGAAFHAATGYRWFALATPLAWVALDFLRTAATDWGIGSVGYPAYSMFEHPTWIQPVSVFGTHGLNLLILVFNWTVAGIVIAAVDRRAGRYGGFPVRRAARWMGGVVVVVGAWVGLSIALLGESDGPTVRVAAVQPAVERVVPASRRPADPAREEFRRNVAATREAARRGAKLIVWREGSLDGDPQRTHTAALRELARSTGAYLAIGWGDERRNDVTVVAPSGAFLGSYGKNHPAPRVETSTNQNSFPELKAPFGEFGTVICYDLDFTDVAREWARRGAGLIAASSADFPGHFATWHYTHLVFRAVENRVAAVKADIAFDSAVIDPYGRIVEKVVHQDGARALVVADVGLGSGRSPQVTLGDWVAQLALAGSIALLAVGWSVRRRGRASDLAPGAPRS